MPLEYLAVPPDSETVGTNRTVISYRHSPSPFVHSKEAVGTEPEFSSPSLGFREGDLLTPSEAAARLRVSKMTVYRLIHAGQLPAFQIGKAFRIKVSDLDAYLEACSVRFDPS